MIGYIVENLIVGVIVYLVWRWKMIKVYRKVYSDRAIADKFIAIDIMTIIGLILGTVTIYICYVISQRDYFILSNVISVALMSMALTTLPFYIVDKLKK